MTPEVWIVTTYHGAPGDGYVLLEESFDTADEALEFIEEAMAGGRGVLARLVEVG